MSARLSTSLTTAADKTPAQIAADPALAGAYASQRSSRLRALASQLLNANTPLPAVSSDVPTLTWSGSASLSRHISPASTELAIIGNPGTWDATAGRLATGGGYTGYDFFSTGANVEIQATEQVANGSLFWIFVNGQPTTAAPSLGMTTTAGGAIVIKAVFSAAARRRITVLAAGPVALNGIQVDFTTSISPAPPAPKIAFVGDSFFGGSAGAPILQACAVNMIRLLGVNGLNLGKGGTGYVNAGATDVYGSASRVAAVAAFNPALIVMSGSVNDGYSAGLQAAAAACYAAYAAALPNVPIIVWGPQPSNATDTISSGRAQVNAAIKAAALAAPNVLAYHDMVGTAGGTVPAAWANSGIYAYGALVTYKGSVYKCIDTSGSYNTGPYTPDTNGRWVLQTYVYTGTGKVGSTTSDGNRDVLQYSDGVHPTVDGALSLAVQQVSDIRADLLAA